MVRGRRYAGQPSIEPGDDTVGEVKKTKGKEVPAVILIVEYAKIAIRTSERDSKTRCVLIAMSSA